MIGISALIIEAPESSLVPLLCEDTRKKIAVYEPGSGFSPDIKLCQGTWISQPPEL